MEPLEHSEQIENLLAGYVLGDLTPEETTQVKQLLEQNPALVTELQSLQSTLAVLPLALPISVPAQQLETRILQAAQADAQTDVSATMNASGSKAPMPPRWQMKPRLWQWGGIVTAVLVAGLGIQTYHLHQRLAATQLENQQLHQRLATAQTTLDQIRKNELATTRRELSRYQEAVNLLRQPNNRFMTLKGSNPKLHSSGSLVMVPTRGAAMLILRDVTVLPKGQVYRIWAFVNGEKVACGDFKPNNQGEVFVQLPLDQWGGTPEVVITVEPDRALTKPVGKMVITGS
jgi:anti-sigma-K factor RskA